MKSWKSCRCKRINQDQHLVITTNEGQNIRMKASDISVLGRNTQGVKLINLKDEEYVTGVAVLEAGEEDEE